MSTSSSSSFEFIKTPAATPPLPVTSECGVRTTSFPAIKNAPLPADGPSSKHFSNLLMFSLMVGVPLIVTRQFHAGFKTFLFLAVVLFIPILTSFWSVFSTLSPRINTKAKYPNRGVEYYLDFKDPADREKYSGVNGKIPMETFHEMYFDGKVEFKGDALDILEYRHDWASFRFTISLYRYFLTGMIPEVIMHTRSQDEEQVRGHYDRGDDFVSIFAVVILKTQLCTN